MQDCGALEGTYVYHCNCSLTGNYKIEVDEVGSLRRTLLFQLWHNTLFTNMCVLFSTA